jgi:hypothetical protein
VTDIEKLVLEKLAKGPVWARSLGNVKPIVDRLVSAGLAERCAPPNGKGKNMVRLAKSES